MKKHRWTIVPPWKKTRASVPRFGVPRGRSIKPPILGSFLSPELNSPARERHVGLRPKLNHHAKSTPARMALIMKRLRLLREHLQGLNLYFTRAACSGGFVFARDENSSRYLSSLYLGLIHLFGTSTRSWICWTWAPCGEAVENGQLCRIIKIPRC